MCWEQGDPGPVLPLTCGMTSLPISVSSLACFVSLGLNPADPSCPKVAHIYLHNYKSLHLCPVQDSGEIGCVGLVGSKGPPTFLVHGF